MDLTAIVICGIGLNIGSSRWRSPSLSDKYARYLWIRVPKNAESAPPLCDVILGVVLFFWPRVRNSDV